MGCMKIKFMLKHFYVFFSLELSLQTFCMIRYFLDSLYGRWLISEHFWGSLYYKYSKTSLKEQKWSRPIRCTNERMFVNRDKRTYKYIVIPNTFIGSRSLYLSTFELTNLLNVWVFPSFQGWKLKWGIQWHLKCFYFFY